MNNELNYGEYIVPLVIATRGYTAHSLSRYAGVGFFIDDGDRIVTCKHIVEECGEGELLFAQDLRSNGYFEVRNVKTHPTCDFAIAQVLGASPHSHFSFADPGTVSLGIDVQALGFTSLSRTGNDICIQTRLFKGYVSRFGGAASTPDSISTLEVSFPSLKGFSGAPIISGPNHELVGMLFSNYESTIEQFKYSEVRDEKEVFSESVHRIVEFGLAQSVDDIRQFVKDLEL